MDNLPINLTDLAVLAVLLISGLLAFARGLVKEVLSVAGWIGAAFATLYLFPYARPYARQYTDIQIAADAATGLGLFVVSLVILSLLSHMIAKQVRASSISALDRSLGFLFGLARGAVLVAIAYLLLVWTIPPADHPPVIREARVIFFVEKTARILALMVPPETRARIEEVLDQNVPGSGSTKVNILNAPPAASNSASDSAADSGSETGYNPQIREGLERILRSKPDE
jgi:membrane protein required for colicin V production